MAVKQVYVIWTNPLFRETVHLLLDHPDIELVGMHSDYTAALENILVIKPDTIVVEEVEGVLPQEIRNFLESYSWDAHIVGFNLYDNTLSIYHHEQRVVSQSDELLHLITSDSI